MTTPLVRHSSVPPESPGWAAHAKRALDWPFLAPGIAAVWGMAALAVWGVLPASALAGWVQEGALVESATLVLYGVALLALCGPGRAVGDWRTRAALGIVVCVMMAREMDLHLRFTGMSVLKLSFYLGAAPPWQKIAAGSVLFALSVPTAWLLLRHGASTLRRLRPPQGPAVTVATLVVVLLVAKVLDRSTGLIVDSGLAVPMTARWLVQWMEEVLEAGVPVLIMVGLLQQRYGHAASGAGRGVARPRGSRHKAPGEST